MTQSKYSGTNFSNITQVKWGFLLLFFFKQKQIDLYEKAIQALEVVQKQVLDEELIGWKRQQQLAGNGLSLDEDSLDDLQQW